MTDSLERLVAGLGDFPLDPTTGPAWIWNQTGEAVLWASPKTDIAVRKSAALALRRTLLPDLASLTPETQPVRVQQLRLARTDLDTEGLAGVETFTCLCRPVQLVDGGYGLMAVAIGASARNLDSVSRVNGMKKAIDLRAASKPAMAPVIEAAQTNVTPPDPTLPDFASPTLEVANLDVSKPASHVEPVAPVAAREADGAAPASDIALTPDASATINTAPSTKPTRFIWQTDAEGRIVHMSRELTDSVGTATGIVMGLTMAEAAKRFGISEADDLATKLAQKESFTAAAIRWPLSPGLQTSGINAFPVEMGGTPVIQNGTFAGFRGYGIIRVDRPLEAPVTAQAALAGEADERQTIIENAHDLFARFGHTGIAATPQSEAPVEPPAKRRPLEIRVPDHPPVSSDAEIAKAPAVDVAAPLPAAKANATTDTPRVLSDDERDAFRQIARSLGQMTAPESPPAAPSLETSVAGTPSEATQTSVPTPVRAGSLDALKRDLARRTRTRLGIKETPPTNTETLARAAAPVIPFTPPRREIRERSEEASTPWATIVDRLPLAMIVMQDGRFVYANAKALELLNYDSLDRFKALASAETLFGAGRDGQAIDQFSVLTQKGIVVPVEAQIQSISWQGQAATLTTLRPSSASTQSKSNEMDLIAARTELRELQSILDTATDGIIVVDGEGRILHLNRSAEALFGFDQVEITGEKLTILLEPESHIAAMDYLEGIRLNGVRSILNDGRDVRGRERKGGALPLFMTISRVGDRGPDSASLNRFCVVLRDITHWKKVEADLTEAKKAAESSSAHKTDFLAKISHEIRTPMNAILGFSQVMMSESFGPLGNDRYRQYAKDIHNSGEHIVSLVNDLLDLSKVAAGKLELNFGSVSVNAVVASAIAMIEPEANNGRVIMRTQLGDQLPMIVADERALRQIVLNLLSNAAKFTGAGGQVFVSTSLTTDGELAIRVRDTGPGMDKEGLKRAMEPFTQLESGQKAKGTGLGLPLTKALADANRARLQIESEPGKGTLAEVIFPSTRVLAE